MSFGLVILPAALADIDEAARWNEGQRLGLGIEFIEEVDAAVQWLARNALLPRVRFRRKHVRWVYPHRFP